MPNSSAGSRLRAALEGEKPLQLVGDVTAFAAMMAERVGSALHISQERGWPTLPWGCRTLALSR